MPGELLEDLERNVFRFVTYGRWGTAERNRQEQRKRDQWRGRKGWEGEGREKETQWREKISPCLLPLHAQWARAAARSTWQTGTVSDSSERAVARGQREAGYSDRRRWAWARGLAEAGKTGSKLFDLAQRFGNWSLICGVRNEWLKILLKLLLDFEAHVFLAHLLKWKRFKITGLYICGPCVCCVDSPFLVKQKNLDSPSPCQASFP